MIRGGCPGISSSCFTNAQQAAGLVLPPQMTYPTGHVAPVATSASTTTTPEFIHDHDQSSSISSFLYNLSVLKEKVHQVQSLASMFIVSNNSSNNYNHNHHLPPPPRSVDKSMAMAIGNLDTLIQEIIVTASSMMFTCQQLALRLGSTPGNEILDPSLIPPNPDHIVTVDQQEIHFGEERGQGFYSNETIDDHHQWYTDNDHGYNNTDDTVVAIGNGKSEEQQPISAAVTTMVMSNNNNNNNSNNYDIVELDAADLLAKYTHYCEICGKGFKRDANLRMHMRAHGDEYKTSAALMSNYNLFKNKNNIDGRNQEDDQQERLSVADNKYKLPRKYSCPQEGCRWNRKHEKFTPLKSKICVKNHYKRSHCPKMYVCKRCNKKQFSVLSDLRTHEKHCGDHLKWLCSCGTTFSRKDKLMGHVGLFIGHSPAIANSSEKMGSKPAATHHLYQQNTTNAVQMQLEDK